MGCSVEQREAHTFSSLLTSLPGSGCPGLPSPGSCHPLLPQLEKGSLLRRGAGKAASMPHSPKTRCFARQQTRAVLEPTLFRLRHPVHHPGLAAGPKVPRAGVRSSFIFSIPFWGGWNKSLLECQCQKALGCSSLLMGTQRAKTFSGPTAGEHGAGMELENNPCSPYLPVPPAGISV